MAAPEAAEAVALVPAPVLALAVAVPAAAKRILTMLLPGCAVNDKNLVFSCPKTKYQPIFNIDFVDESLGSSIMKLNFSQEG